MNSKFYLIAFALCVLVSCKGEVNDAAETHSTIDTYYTGALAYETTAFVAQYWRLAGNSGFNNSIDFLVDKLESSGYVLEDNASPDDRFTYRLEEYPLKNPTWEPISGRLSLEGESKALLDFTTNRNMICINSKSTPSDGINATVVYIEAMEDLSEIDVAGKIVYAEMHPYQLFQKAVVEGKALGLLTYSNPGYLKPKKNKTSIQFRSIPYSETDDGWAIALSYEANEKLKKQLQSGRTNVHVALKTKLYESIEYTVVAKIRGKTRPDEGLVFSAHVQEPGANDNASGVGVQLEMAVSTKKMIDEQKQDIDRSLTFLWGDEIISTRRYTNDSIRDNPKIKWGISLDMVGENTAVTGGSFLIEKMPDPSAIWTRGKDRHTEWGGTVLEKEDMKPHYLNDLAVDIMMRRGQKKDWEVNTNPYEGGSDHVPFLRKDIPSVLFWHFTDQFYHTDQDNIDKVSKETLNHVGRGSLEIAVTLLNANAATAEKVVLLLVDKAKQRLNDEFMLSQKKLNHETSLAQEIDIIQTWNIWYQDALATTNDMIIDQDSKHQDLVSNAQQEIQQLTDLLVNQLKNQAQ